VIKTGSREVVRPIIAKPIVAIRQPNPITSLDQTYHARRCINTYQLNANILLVSTVAVLNDSRWHST
jgi:hypothetical protein